jgi:hypothetical protein
LHDLSFQYDISNDNSKLEDHSIQVWWYGSSLNRYKYPHTFLIIFDLQKSFVIKL